ncbi:unnamed protein product [Moneuplotes crassus]|uniref:Uncharacterized protein n=1 Tax=Euplotes crassus TaxID=5936 RepID=A0AAD1XRM1_EUPCR|nr:unnamed protein product [Moneuplotes crassus]
MDVHRKNYSTTRKMAKSKTTYALLRPKDSNRRRRVPTLEERKAGGVYAKQTKKTINPLQAQIDFLTSGYIHSHGLGMSSKIPLTERKQFNSPGFDNSNLEAIRKQFVQNSNKLRNNPITHKPFYNKIKKPRTDIPTQDILGALESAKPAEIAPEPSERDVLEPQSPLDERNLIYHDSDSQAGLIDRYVTENNEIGRKLEKRNTASSPHLPSESKIINKVFKNKPSLMTIFPSYGVKMEKDPFSTTNQLTEMKKCNEKPEMPDRAHFRQVYNMKTYMEEMLKAKNMRGEKK